LNVIQKISKDKEMNNPANKTEILVNTYIAQKYPYIYYNLALTFFQSGKFEEAAEIWGAISEHMLDNPKLWYRIGTCYLNKYHTVLKDNHVQRRNNLYNAILDIQIVTSNDEERTSLPTETAKMKKPEEPSLDNKEPFNFTRYVLNTKEHPVQDNEEDLNPLPNNSYKSLKNIELNKANESIPYQNNDKQLRSYLDKALKCFRDTLIMLKKKRLKEAKEGDITLNIKNANDYGDTIDTNAPNINEMGDKTEEVKENKKNELLIKAPRNSKELEDLYQSTYVHLSYISLCLGEINSAANFAKEALELPFISEENKFLCLIYLVEYYCTTGSNHDALNSINKVSLTQTIQTAARNILGNNQAYFAYNMNNKIVIYTNLAMVHIMNNNLAGAQNAINIALSNIENSQSPTAQIPIPLLNMMIYIYIRNDNYIMALQLLKRRRMLQNSKILLKIMK